MRSAENRAWGLFLPAWIAMLVAAFWSQPSGAQPAKRMIAVLEFVNDAGLTAFEIQALSDDVRGAALLLSRDRFAVMTRENMLMLLPPGADLAQCSGAQCEVDAGRKVGADLVVSGQVGRFADELEVRLKLFDTRTARLLAQEKVLGAGLKVLRAAMQDRAVLLFRMGLQEGPSAALGTPAVPGTGAAPGAAEVPAPAVPTVQATGPRVRKASATVAVADLIVSARAAGDVPVRLELTGPGGERIVRGSPFKDPQARPGRWEVTALATGHEPVTRIFDAPPDEPTLVKLELKPYGALKVIGEPLGARVDVSGPGSFENNGGLPWEAEGLPSGNYRVRVSREGYNSLDQWTTVSAGETREVPVSLSKVAKKAEAVKARPIRDDAPVETPRPSGRPSTGGSKVELGFGLGIQLGIGGLLEGAGSSETKRQFAVHFGGTLEFDIARYLGLLLQVEYSAMGKDVDIPVTMVPVLLGIRARFLKDTRVAPYLQYDVGWVYWDRKDEESGIGRMGTGASFGIEVKLKTNNYMDISARYLCPNAVGRGSGYEPIHLLLFGLAYRFTMY